MPEIKEKTDRLTAFFGQMVMIRYFETVLEDMFGRGELFGTIHGCIGQEACAVGVVNALAKDDIITGTHRSHGHFLAYTGDVEGLMAEIMGKACGVVGGRGGSQHLHAANFYSNGVQGSLVPVATGMALAESLNGTKALAACFLGDGTLGQGVVYESMNMASLWGLPIVYIVENNLYAMSTPIGQAVAGSIRDRGKAFGIETRETTSADVRVIFEEACDIFRTTRKSSRPFFWVINTYRLCGHSKGDDRCYREKAEEDEWHARDPLALAGDLLPADVRGTIEAACKKRVDEAYEKLKGAAYPAAGAV